MKLLIVINDAVILLSGAGAGAEWPLSAVDGSRIGFTTSNAPVPQGNQST